MRFTATIRKEGAWFVAQCLEIDVASQGETQEAALDNLREAVELRLEDEDADALPPCAAVVTTFDVRV